MRTLAVLVELVTVERITSSLAESFFLGGLVLIGHRLPGTLGEVEANQFPPSKPRSDSPPRKNSSSFFSSPLNLNLFERRGACHRARPVCILQYPSAVSILTSICTSLPLPCPLLRSALEYMPVILMREHLMLNIHQPPTPNISPSSRMRPALVAQEAGPRHSTDRNHASWRSPVRLTATVGGLQRDQLGYRGCCAFRNRWSQEKASAA